MIMEKDMDDRITLAHGAGGGKYRELVENVFLPAYGCDELAKMGDSAICMLGASTQGQPALGALTAGARTQGQPALGALTAGARTLGARTAALSPRLAFTTDSFVVAPLFFPGGDIGSLCVSGTVNDIAMSGAVPLYLSVAMILEAGLDVDVLRRVCESIAKAAREAGVKIVAGDTKVVERGKADKMYITTAGVGAVSGEWALPEQRAQAGDVIICSGTVANHGMAVMAVREGLELSTITSDARPLASLAAAALKTGARINAMRDPTRGGVGATVCEWSEGAANGGGVNITLNEGALPLRADTRAACALLGIDPLFVANEGIMLLSVRENDAQSVLDALHAHEYGREAAIIGRVTTGEGKAYIKTEIGTTRGLILPRGEILPRIC